MQEERRARGEAGGVFSHREATSQKGIAYGAIILSAYGAIILSKRSWSMGGGVHRCYSHGPECFPEQLKAWQYDDDRSSPQQ
mmetsp:Transcript_4593/g.9216  ORF Transcript_4593/g.9216 Transcript_4593/m.9216 type:complete len:82 (+) Transcript_4593:805-1050(+)